MTHELHHRGPDDQRTRHWPEATLIHTRLSIIDLSPTGAQPMPNEDGTVWTVFNGEIYNHRELRLDLEADGHVFQGRSDTEILPHLYERFGPAFLAKLRGMFALAIYDTRTNTLLLARDRFGIKPLFYAPSETRLAFASEIGALRCIPGLDDRLDRQALYDCAALAYVPAPATAFVGIRALQPCEFLEARWHGDVVRWSTRSYHRWSITPRPEMSLAEATSRADDLVTRAVRAQLESDVPLASLLSGGIDSSLVSAAAQAATKSLRTFSVRFPDRQYDETWAAVAVAEHIGSSHEILDVRSGEASWEQVTGLLRRAGQPFADTSLFAVNAVCRLMRQHVAVALSGDGGDESFGGYDTYWRLGRIAPLLGLPAPLWRGAAAGLTPLARFGVVRSWLPQRVQELTAVDDTSLVQSFYCMPAPEHEALCPDTDLLPVRRLFEPHWVHTLPPGASRLERLSARVTETDMRLVLPNDFLFKVDTASMKESLEVRVPMLDEDLVEFGLALPHRLKVKGKVCKRVLRQVAVRRLPPRVAAKRKMGFAVPVDVWVSRAFKLRLKETLLGKLSRLPDIFRPDVYKPWVESFCSDRPCFGLSRGGLQKRAMMLLTMHLALNGSEN